ncbi:MAG: energy transducer TonB [Candidatus Accumulibacter sp.]|mgnify:FL=1|uniref:TonB family protein n=1 Tax=Accumulibacter sp. TaxID=2053492 RepID=UPI001A52F679|nr:TonB family protein [Accumulibacter sp.]MBL8393041.1 energy transducer TonB [Accumulibacter sp.]HRD90967.1 TonB family protein [Accumulibacter sp.]
MYGGAAAREVDAADSRSGAATPGTAISADDLRQYRVDLAIASRRFKRYPVLARERGWEGRVEVAVTVSAWQPRPQLSLFRSSGHAALDQQAVAMLEQASASTALPAGLKGRDFRLLLPVDFMLDDDR